MPYRIYVALCFKLGRKIVFEDSKGNENSINVMLDKQRMLVIFAPDKHFLVKVSIKMYMHIRTWNHS